LEATYVSSPEAIRHCRIGLELPDIDSEVRSELAGGLTVNLASMGELEQSEHALAVARQHAINSPELPGDVLLLTAQSMIEFYRPDWNTALRTAHQAIRQ